LPGPNTQKYTAGQRNHVAGQFAKLLAGKGQLLGERMYTQVAVVTEHEHGAQKHHPDKQKSGHFFRKSDSGVKAISQDDIAKHKDHH
jgi:hypothetical protein